MIARSHRFAGALVGLLFVLVGTAGPALAKEPPCTAAEAADADKQLWLNAADQKLSIGQHLPWGTPSNPAATNEHLLVERDYVVDYDDDLRVPVWTAHRIVSSALGKAKRKDCFRQDVRLASAVASSPTDYKEPIFDQGHMVPNGDMSMSTTAVLNSFVMSNMTPQFCQLNQGVWQILEELVRRWAGDQKTLYVISGTVFDRDGLPGRDADNTALRMKSNNGKRRVAIPSAFYKILAYPRPDGSINTLTVLLPHDQTDLDADEAVAYLNKNVTTVAAIEQKTGMTFFTSPGVSTVEASTLWTFTGAAPRSLARKNPNCPKTAGAVIQ